MRLCAMLVRMNRPETTTIGGTKSALAVAVAVAAEVAVPARIARLGRRVIMVSVTTYPVSARPMTGARTRFQSAQALPALAATPRIVALVMDRTAMRVAR